MRKIKIKCAEVVLGCTLFVLCLTGCGKEISIQIQDANETTEMTTTAGKTVDKILDEAELSLRDGDQIEPSLKKTVSKNHAIITIARKVTVTIRHADEEPLTITRNGGTVQDAITEAGITLDEKSSVDKELQAYLYDGMEIKVVELSAVELTVDGETKRILSPAKTVQEFLDENLVKIGKKDRLSAELEDPIKDEMKLKIQRVTTKKITEKETIAYETTTEYSSSLASGKSQVKQSGVNGTKKVTYKVTYVDGKEESRKVVGTKVIKAAQNEIVVQGTKKASTSGGSGSGGGKKVVSREYFDDCDGSGHGVCIITYSDGSTSQQTY